MKLVKKQLARELAHEFETSIAQAERMLTAVFDNFAENLGAGHDIDIAGFGKFSIRVRKAGVSRNPQTGETKEVPAKCVLKFTPKPELKNAVAAIEIED
jgi:DNA-binding protein HU-beta